MTTRGEAQDSNVSALESILSKMDNPEQEKKKAGNDNADDADNRDDADEGEDSELDAQEGDDDQDSTSADEDEAGDDEDNADDSDPSQEPTEDETAEDSDKKLYSVTANGQEHKVTLEELKKGWSLETDYRQKTAALAEERRKVENLVDAEQKKYQTALFDILSYVKVIDELALSQEEMDNLFQTDPAEYARLTRMKSKREEAIKRLQSEAQKTNEESKAKSEKQIQDFRRQEQKLLVERNPEFRDVKHLQKTGLEVGDYLHKNGYTAEEVQTLEDHRAFTIALKAMRYDKLMANKEQKKTPAKVKVRPTSKDGAPATDKREQNTLKSAMRDLKKTGSREARIKALEHFV